VSDHQADYPIATMCRLLGVSPSGYYAWRKRRPSHRTKTDTALTTEIRAAHATSRGIYGVPRIHAELAAKGVHVGRKRVARLMSQAGLAGVSRRKFVVTTVKGDGRRAPDLVERNFAAQAPNRLWVADITYIPTWSGFLYLAVVLDAFSRRVVGWSMATTLATQLVLDALSMALLTRRPKGVIHHSDQGSQPGLVATPLRRSCGDEAQAAFGSVWSGAIVLTRSSASGRTRSAPTVLGGDRDRHGECGCCRPRWDVAACGNEIVPRGRRHATSDVPAISEASVRPAPLICGAGGDRTSSSARLL
jgi:putative transposase